MDKKYNDLMQLLINVYLSLKAIYSFAFEIKKFKKEISLQIRKFKSFSCKFKNFSQIRKKFL